MSHLPGLTVHLCSRVNVRAVSENDPHSGYFSGREGQAVVKLPGRRLLWVAFFWLGGRHPRAVQAATSPGPRSSVGCPGPCSALVQPAPPRDPKCPRPSGASEKPDLECGQWTRRAAATLRQGLPCEHPAAAISFPSHVGPVSCAPCLH